MTEPRAALENSNSGFIYAVNKKYLATDILLFQIWETKHQVQHRSDEDGTEINRQYCQGL